MSYPELFDQVAEGGELLRDALGDWPEDAPGYEDVKAAREHAKRAEEVGRLSWAGPDPDADRDNLA
jgi:hypothetical protein